MVTTEQVVDCTTGAVQTLRQSVDCVDCFAGEINSTVTDAAAATQRIEEHYRALEGVELDHLDGLTVTGDTWWFNLRASNTEPLLRLNVEATTAKEMASIRDSVLKSIRA